jgi:hypothetical protein
LQAKSSRRLLIVSLNKILPALVKCVRAVSTCPSKSQSEIAIFKATLSKIVPSRNPSGGIDVLKNITALIDNPPTSHVGAGFNPGLSKLADARMSLRDMDALKGIPT